MDGLSERVVLQGGEDRVRHHDIHSGDPQDFLQVLLYGNQTKRCAGAVERDQQIHVALWTSLITRDRVEERQRRDAKLAV